MKGLFQSEEEILVALRSGNKNALNLLYKMHFPMVLHFIIKNNGSEQEARDVYQEGVIVFYEQIQKPDFVLGCKIKTYIYSVCRRLWLKSLAHKSRFMGRIDDFESFIPIEDGQAEEIDEKAKQFEAMKQALDKIGEPCKTILTDFFIHSLNMQQITDKMGYTNADNTKNQKYKCLMRLKKIFFSGYNPQY
jgi:RNA polymerase sigma factor (sigma-70 family)